MIRQVLLDDNDDNDDEIQWYITTLTVNNVDMYSFEIYLTIITQIHDTCI